MGCSSDHFRIYNPRFQLEYEPLREWGYVFWDVKRLHASGIRVKVKNLADLPWGAHDSHLWIARKSVHARLEHVHIRLTEMQKIVQEFCHEY